MGPAELRITARTRYSSLALAMCRNGNVESLLALDGCHDPRDSHGDVVKGMYLAVQEGSAIFSNVFCCRNMIFQIDSKRFQKVFKK